MPISNFNVVHVSIPWCHEEDQSNYVRDAEDEGAAAAEEWNDKALEMAKKKPFRLMDLPAELRNRIYGFFVDVNEYRPRYKRSDNDERVFVNVAMRGRMPLELRTPLKVKTRRQDPRQSCIFVGKGPKLYGYSLPAKPTALPNILRVSKQVREEALAVFYEVNMFIFYGCPANDVAKWIINTTGNFKSNLEKVMWQGNRFATEEDAVAMATVLLLEVAGLTRDTLFFFADGIRSHLPCHITAKLKELKEEDGKFLGKTPEEIKDMSFDDLKALVSNPVSGWWDEIKDKIVNAEECPECSKVEEDGDTAQSH